MAGPALGRHDRVAACRHRHGSRWPREHPRPHRYRAAQHRQADAADSPGQPVDRQSSAATKAPRIVRSCSIVDLEMAPAVALRERPAVRARVAAPLNAVKTGRATMKHAKVLASVAMPLVPLRGHRGCACSTEPTKRGAPVVGAPLVLPWCQRLCWTLVSTCGTVTWGWMSWSQSW